MNADAFGLANGVSVQFIDTMKLLGATYAIRGNIGDSTIRDER